MFQSFKCKFCRLKIFVVVENPFCPTLGQPRLKPSVEQEEQEQQEASPN